MEENSGRLLARLGFQSVREQEDTCLPGMEYVVLDGPQWGTEFDKPLYSLKDWGSVSSYIDHGDGDDSDACTSAPQNGSPDDSPLKGAVSPRSGDGNVVAEARASAEAARAPDDGTNDRSSEGVGDLPKVGGSERKSVVSHGEDCDENEEVGVRSDDEVGGTSIRGDMNGVSRSSNSNHADGAEQDVNFDFKTSEHDRSDNEIDSFRDDLNDVTCAEGAEGGRNANFDFKTSGHDRSDNEIDSIRDDHNDANCAEGAEGGRNVNLNSEHDRQSDGTTELAICAQTGNKRTVDSQNEDEVIPDTEDLGEAGEHNEFGFSDADFLTPKPLKVVAPPRKKARKEEDKAKKETAKTKKGEKKKKKTKETNETHQCDICSKNFKFKWRLREHQVVHSNEKQFACEFPGCASKYKRKSDLNTHMGTHSTRR